MGWVEKLLFRLSIALYNTVEYVGGQTYVSEDALEAWTAPVQCMSFNYNFGVAPPIEANIESGSRVNLHLGVMVRGDGLHPAALWPNYPGDLCPSG